MAYDSGLADLMREDLHDLHGISEKKMFGGLCFLLNGNMLCGVHSGGAMYRVGKANESEALSIDGAGPMQFTGRPMGGLIDVADHAMAEDDRRQIWLKLATEFVGSLPPK